MFASPPTSLISQWHQHLNHVWTSPASPCLAYLHPAVNSRVGLWIEIETRFWEREVLYWKNSPVTASIFDDDFSSLFGTFRGPAQPANHGFCGSEELVNCAILQILSTFHAIFVTADVVSGLTCNQHSPSLHVSFKLIFHGADFHQLAVVSFFSETLEVAEHVQLDTPLGLIEELYHYTLDYHLSRVVLPTIITIVPSWQDPEDVFHELIIWSSASFAVHDMRSNRSLTVESPSDVDFALESGSNPILELYRSPTVPILMNQVPVLDLCYHKKQPKAQNDVSLLE
ncbi:hypothetical protein C8J56DRAFT_1065991 [Mycena floridula]|nr:hypothetical protein C8J56DRAFT_1065991 [Mycena floridula]